MLPSTLNNINALYLEVNRLYILPRPTSILFNSLWPALENVRALIFLDLFFSELQ